MHDCKINNLLTKIRTKRLRRQKKILISKYSKETPKNKHEQHVKQNVQTQMRKKKTQAQALKGN